MPASEPSRPPDDRPLTLVTLGGASASYPANGGAPKIVRTPGKLLALVIYVACAPGRSASREHLIDLLWATATPDGGRVSIRAMLLRVKRELGNGVLSAGDETIALLPPLTSDRDDFFAALEAKDYEAAVTLYTGDFLPCFPVADGGADFEVWSDLERGRMREMFLHAAGTVVRRWLSAGHFRNAVALARRARDAAPFKESTWRLVLEALIAAGDYLGASLEADALDRMLADQELKPEPATVHLLGLARQLPADRGRHTESGSLVAELVGREREFSAVVAAWDEGRLSGVRHFHLAGPPGIGKTRLLQDLHARLRAMRARVATVRARPGERQVPYAVASDLAAVLVKFRGSAGVAPAIAGSLVALDPSLSSHYPNAVPDTSAGGDALRRRTIAVAELLAAVAEDRPLALFVDDMHWSDPASRQVLNGVIGRARKSAVLVVTSARPETAAEVPTGESVVLALAPLGAVEVAAMIASIGPLPSEPWAEQLVMELHATTGGSPLVVLETLQLAIERESLVLSGLGWTCPDFEALRAELQRGGALRHRIATLDVGARSVLRALALAGSPLSVGRLARAARTTQSGVEAALGTLEQRGLAARIDEDWQPAHDEIGAIALDSSDPGERRQANVTLGRVFAEDARADVSLLRRAAPLLAAGGENLLLGAVFAKWVAHAHRRGDRRRPTALATELLGDESRPERVFRLVASLPLYRRFGLDSVGRLAAAVVLVSSAVAMTRVLSPAPIPASDVVLVGYRPTEPGGPVVRRATLSREHWSERSSVDLASVDETYPRVLLISDASGVVSIAPHPDGQRWAIARTVSDSGGLDIWIVDRQGVLRRLTNTTGDDRAPDWSPDGKSLVFQTDRWGFGRSRSDIALLDTATLAVRALSHGNELDQMPSWSPDGTRIAFVRKFFETSEPDAVCWTTLESQPARCVNLHGYLVRELKGWKNPDRVLVGVDSGGTAALVSADLAGSSVNFIGTGNGWRAISLDGQWVACHCTRPGYRGQSSFVFPVDRPDQAKAVRFGPGRPTDFWLTWAPGQKQTPYLERIEIEVPPAGIPQDARYQLRARGVDALGEEAGVHTLRWWSEDVSVAEVDSAGVLLPRRQGRVRIFASAGGWRFDSATVDIRAPRSTGVLREAWTEPFADRWVLAGEPPPRIVSGPGAVPALWHAGDSTWASGVYSRMYFRATTGLGLEARVSTPITEVQWQSLDILVGSARDSATMARWDHVTGWVSAIDYSVGFCGMSYPSGEGAMSSKRLLLRSSNLTREVPVGPQYSTSAWYTMRVQIFPDGRCGFALDGKPLWLSENDIPIIRPFRLAIEGRSFRTRMLVGSLEVWEGIRSDIDWSTVETTSVSGDAVRR